MTFVMRAKKSIVGIFLELINLKSLGAIKSVSCALRRHAGGDSVAN
jgi:hypothetical protein